MSVAALVAVAAMTAGAEPSVLRLGPKAPSAVERVVTLAPSLTATVLALGAGSTLVGVTRFDDAPEVASLPRVGGFVDPSVEATLALKPQWVVAQKAPGNRQAVEKMARLGISVTALPLTTVHDVLTAIEELGKTLGRPERAKELVRAVEETRTEVRSRAARRGKRTVMVVYGFKPLVLAGPGSFAHELLTDVGAVNVAAKAPSPYPVFSLEKAVAEKPDLVVDCSDTAEGRDEVRGLMRGPRWVQPSSRALLQPGPGLAAALRELEQLVWSQ